MKTFLDRSREWAALSTWEQVFSLALTVALGLLVNHLAHSSYPGLIFAMPNTLVTPTNVMKRIGRRLVNNLKFGSNVMRSLIVGRTLNTVNSVNS